MGVKVTPGGFAAPGTAMGFRTGTWRIQRPEHVHGIAPCHHACLAGEDPQAWIASLAEGDVAGAWQRLIAANPLPASTGRVCPHPCETACNRGGYDAPLNVHGLERWLGDAALAAGWACPAPAIGRDVPAVAVVGAGPAGLSCAWQLLRRGIRPVLLEALNQAGGVPRTAIPPYRLPRAVLDGEIERLLATGIEFRPHQRLGRDFSLEELETDFAAVFLAVGTQKSRPYSVEGVVPRDLRFGLDLLRHWIAEGAVPVMDSVAIIGGGNTAVDVARILKRAGVREVHLITHERMPHAQVPDYERMRAAPDEIVQALEEGVLIHENRMVRRLILRGERVVGVEIVHARKLKEGERVRVQAFEGTESVLKVDQVIPAIGQVVNEEGLAQLLGQREFLRVEADGRVPGTSRIFAGGDCRPGLGTVAGAIFDGARAAAAIADLLGRHETRPQRGAVVGLDRLNLHYFDHAPRQEPPVLPVSERAGDREVQGGLDQQAAHAEALRCFSCGNCMACDNCFTLCPDNAVLKTRAPLTDGSHYVFDYDYCKGCGLCAHECPVGYIAMVEEE
ncbi:FAD-dependent oxidoreductase [Thiobacter aerophilum]|uniref:FAD-dependent oxidoreductase n=1 Tax=Thiobacter aerophilum TaxID=3121275 RepID=A0ABV0EBY0_9BURK